MNNDNNEQLPEVIVKLWIFYSLYLEETYEKKPFISKHLCPRCGVVHLPGEAVLAATSVLSPEDAIFYICNDCALPDKMSIGIDDFLNWAIAKEEFM